MRSRVLLVAAASVLGFAPAPLPRQERQRGQDQADVGGVWEFVECQVNGAPHNATPRDFYVETARNKFTFVGKNGQNRVGYDMQIDPTASPPSFTWGGNNQVSWVGSYRVQNGQMTMAFNNGTSLAQRPTDLDGKKAQWRYVLRRLSR
jgi:uncharacterized protein (TIGR03067 family)